MGSGIYVLDPASGNTTAAYLFPSGSPGNANSPPIIAGGGLIVTAGARLIKFVDAVATVTPAPTTSPTVTPTATVTPFQSGTPVAQVSFTARFSGVYIANISVFDVSTVTLDVTLDTQNLLLRNLQGDALAAVFSSCGDGSIAP